MCTIYLIIIPKAWDGFHFNELCILIHDFTVQGLCGVTIGVGEIRFSKFCSETVFSRQGYFFNFLKFLVVFANRSDLPIFRVLKALVPSEYGNEVLFSQKSYFIIKNVHNLT